MDAGYGFLRSMYVCMYIVLPRTKIGTRQRTTFPDGGAGPSHLMTGPPESWAGNRRMGRGRAETGLAVPEGRVVAILLVVPCDQPPCGALTSYCVLVECGRQSGGVAREGSHHIDQPITGPTMGKNGVLSARNYLMSRSQSYFRGGPTIGTQDGANELPLQATALGGLCQSSA